MKFFPHRRLKYHTWRDIGGLFGLLLDGLFCAFVLISAFFMLALCAVLLVVDYLVSPVLAAISRIKAHRAA